MITNDDRILLILDLDETLFFSSEKPLNRQPDFVFHVYDVYVRPGLQEFLARMAAAFDLAVWTSSSPDYASFFVDRIFAGFDLRFVWASDRCTLRFDHDRHRMNAIKDFRKLRRKGIDLNRVLMVDDSPEKHTRNYGNLVLVRPFEGDPGDHELALLAPYLESLRNCRNCRAIDKRLWRLDLNLS